MALTAVTRSASVVHSATATATATVATAVAVVMSVAACSGGTDGPARPGPSPSTAAASATDDQARSEATKVLAAYNGFREQYITAAGTASFDNRLLPSYVADPLLAELRFALRQQSEQGIVYRGRPAWKAQVTKLDLAGRTAILSDCFDNNSWRAVYKSTGKAVPAPTQAQRYVITSTATYYDNGKWLIRTSEPDRSRTC